MLAGIDGLVQLDLRRLAHRFWTVREDTSLETLPGDLRGGRSAGHAAAVTRSRITYAVMIHSVSDLGSAVFSWASRVAPTGQKRRWPSCPAARCGSGSSLAHRSTFAPPQQPRTRSSRPAPVRQSPPPRRERQSTAPRGSRPRGTRDSGGARKAMALRRRLEGCREATLAGDPSRALLPQKARCAIRPSLPCSRQRECVGPSMRWYRCSTRATPSSAIRLGVRARPRCVRRPGTACYETFLRRLSLDGDDRHGPIPRPDLIQAL